MVRDSHRRKFHYPNTTEVIEPEDYGMNGGGDTIEVRKSSPQHIAYWAWKIFRGDWDYFAEDTGDLADEWVAHCVATLTPKEREEFDTEMLVLEHEYREEFGEDA